MPVRTLRLASTVLPHLSPPSSHGSKLGRHQQSRVSFGHSSAHVTSREHSHHAGQAIMGALCRHTCSTPCRLPSSHRAKQGQATAEGSRVADSRGDAKFVSLLLDLAGQLASGRQNKEGGPLPGIPARGLHVQEPRQQEAAGLARPSLGDGHQVPALQGNWPGLGLDGGGLSVASSGDLRGTGRTVSVRLLCRAGGSAGQLLAWLRVSARPLGRGLA